MYADAELLILQNKLSEAETKLDNLLSSYPGHSITDEVFYQRYKIAFQRGNFLKAEEHLKTLLSIDDTDILADNALFRLAQLYDYHLNDSEKAKTHYQRLLTDYSSSFFTTPARKRFRSLRGDKLN
jgi:tetratricopeptide (TPR) repeat protein